MLGTPLPDERRIAAERGALILLDVGQPNLPERQVPKEQAELAHLLRAAVCSVPLIRQQRMVMKEPGSGLLTKGIVDRHHGRITFRSKESVETVFRVFVPYQAVVPDALTTAETRHQTIRLQWGLKTPQKNEHVNVLISDGRWNFLRTITQRKL